jgi:steroid 5-alpha reductase family enzyme
MSDFSRWLAILSDSNYLLLGASYTAYMTLLWWLRRPLRNAGLVDLGWPSGLVALGVYFFVTGEGWTPRKAVLCGMYAFCGLRFLIGWTVRTVRDGEDRRWGYWRQHWSAGKGPLGIRSAEVNFLLFYHAQTFGTLLIAASPLGLSCANGSRVFHPLEIIAIGLWLAGFAGENLADYQLDQFRRSGDGGKGVCRAGLWNYSRHPNYFCELLLWIAYALYAWPSASTWVDWIFLAATPVCMYGFLVYYTGIPLTEQASLERRGAVYRQYQLEVNRFFPWFSRRGQ